MADMSPLFVKASPTLRQTLAGKLASRTLASGGMTVIWNLHVVAAHAHRHGRWCVSDMLIGSLTPQSRHGFLVQMEIGDDVNGKPGDVTP